MEHFKYRNISTKEEVKDVDALDYVAEKCGFEMVNETEMSKEFIDSTVEWFFSGNWVEVEDDESHEDETESIDLLDCIDNIYRKLLLLSSRNGG